jgi:hypothetical protein
VQGGQVEELVYEAVAQPYLSHIVSPRQCQCPAGHQRHTACMHDDVKGRHSTLSAYMHQAFVKQGSLTTYLFIVSPDCRHRRFMIRAWGLPATMGSVSEAPAGTHLHTHSHHDDRQEGLIITGLLWGMASHLSLTGHC